MNPKPIYAIFAGSLYYPIGGWDDLKYLSNKIKRRY